jgi:polyisoprenoid-binding protein YceI
MGVTKNVPLALKVTGFGPDAGRTRAGFTATGELNWQDFEVTRNVVLEAGRAAVDGKLTICLQIQAVLQARAALTSQTRNRTDRRQEPR